MLDQQSQGFDKDSININQTFIYMHREVEARNRKR